MMSIVARRIAANSPQVARRLMRPGASNQPFGSPQAPPRAGLADIPPTLRNLVVPKPDPGFVLVEGASKEAEEIAGLIQRSRAAQAKIANYTQEQVDDLITAMVWAVAEESTAKMIAAHTVEETQLGNYEGKYLKIFRKTRCALMDIIDDRSVGVVEEVPARGLVKLAKPVGVIGALSPSTNPEATPVIKAISAVKGKNSIVVAPHPRAAKTNALIVGLLRGACERMGAPRDLVLGVDNPSVLKTEELMRQCDRVLATGGSAMVRAAYSSGTPALGVGVGNAVVTVDKSADLDDAAKKIALSKTLDLAASCSADNSLILLDQIYDQMVTKLVARGGLVLSAEQKAKLQAVIWNEKGQINARIVAQPAAAIAELAGFSIPAGTEFFLAPETGWGPSHPFSGEKMCVTAALYRARDLGHAIEITRGIQAYQGSGHSAGIYTSDKGSALALAHALDTSRLLVKKEWRAAQLMSCTVVLLPGCSGGDRLGFTRLDRAIL